MISLILGHIFQLNFVTPEIFVLGLPSHSVSAWAKANRPITAGKIPIPDINPVIPYVKRGKAVAASMLIVLANRPKRPAISPLKTAPNETAAIAVSPNSATTKYSEGPKRRETLASGGASHNSTKPLIIPPITDAKVDIRIASMALPRLVIS
jgi:hypothetical protein